MIKISSRLLLRTYILFIYTGIQLKVNMADENDEQSTANILKIMAEKLNKIIDSQDTLAKKVSVLDLSSLFRLILMYLIIFI